MLGAILGYAEISKHMIAARKTNDIDDYMDEILNAGNRAKELIQQMLTFSRLAPASSDDESPVTLLSPVVKEVTYLLRSSIPSTIDLIYKVENADIKARIQPVNLHQIIMNLGINALDAIGEYGKINITLSILHAAEQVCSSCKHPFEGRYAKLTVSDTGSGISESVCQNIFNPFFTTKSAGKGTGMGLAVVHGLMHGFGGHIQVESVVGKSTSFTILLPLVINPAVEETHPVLLQNKSNTLEGLRIMVVDDEIPLSRMLQEALGLHGAQVTSFNSPLDAWSTFEKRPEDIDIVITDETMPGLSGMHLAERMLKLKPGLPVILCTGYSEHATPELAQQAGLAGFFYKPLFVNDLIQKIQSILDEK